MTNNFYFLYVRGMQRPGFLYADTVGILSNSEGLSVASALFLQYGSLEYLNSLTVTLKLGTSAFSCAASRLLIISFIVFLLIHFDVLNTLPVTEDHLLFLTTHFILSYFF